MTVRRRLWRSVNWGFRIQGGRPRYRRDLTGDQSAVYRDYPHFDPHVSFGGLFGGDRRIVILERPGFRLGPMEGTG